MAAAAHQLILNGIITWPIILRKFYSAALRSTTSVGYRGEVATQILVLLAMQNCISDRSQEITSFPAFSASSFICELLGTALDGVSVRFLNDGTSFKCQQVSGTTALARNFGTSIVRPYHFVKTFANPDSSMLFGHFLRGAAIYCKENQVGIDLVLPMYLDNDLNKSLDDKSISGIVIQARLRKSFSSILDNTAWYHSVQEFDFLAGKPFIALYIEYGPLDSYAANAEAEVVEFPNNRGYCIFTRRLSPRSIRGKQSLFSDFQQILRSSIDPSTIAYVPEWVSSKVKRMFKHQPYNIAD
jgi:hypothetical protein